MYFRVFGRQLRMPLVLAFGLVATFIWFAENIATWAGAWFYPDQLAGWQPVGPTKLAAWFLLMIISVVLVTWVYPPVPPDRVPDNLSSARWSAPGRRHQQRMHSPDQVSASPERDGEA